MPDLPTFQKVQYEFSAHVRNPQQHARPDDVEDRRMEIYRDLLYRNIEGFLSGGFPVLCEIHSEADWHALVRDFFDRHRSSTPYFPEIGQEFLAYLQDERGERNSDFPFLLELAHYEWTEIALDVADVELDEEAANPNGDLLEEAPLISPLAWPLRYRFPVHRISPDFLPTEPAEQPTDLIVYRDRKDQVRFMETNPATLHLMQKISAHPALSGRQVLEEVAREMQHPEPEVVIQGGRQTLQRLLESDVILGTRPAGG